MMNPIAWVKLQAEGLKFGWKLGQELRLTNIMMPDQEIQIRVVLAWADHLVATDRSCHVKKPEVVEKLRSAVSKLDDQRREAMYQTIEQAFPITSLN